MRIKCHCCKEEIEIQPYFYDIKIMTRQYTPFEHTEYTARVRGKCTCYCCGTELDQSFSMPISQNEIITIATRKESK